MQSIANIGVTQALPGAVGQFIFPSDPNDYPRFATISETTLGASANDLTPSDRALISSVTGAHFSTSPQGLQMTQAYSSGIPISSKDFSAALAQVQQWAKIKHLTITPADMQDLALGGAEFGYVQNFTNAIVSIRQSIGQDQNITPAMISAAMNQSNAINATIPQDYITNAIGYLSGLG